MTQVKYINIYEDATCKFISDEEYDSYQSAFAGRDSLSTYIETIGIVRPVENKEVLVVGKDELTKVWDKLEVLVEGKEDKKDSLNKVTRVEVINYSKRGETGRVFTDYEVKHMELQYQDDGRTLKIFINA